MTITDFDRDDLAFTNSIDWDTEELSHYRPDSAQARSKPPRDIEDIDTDLLVEEVRRREAAAEAQGWASWLDQFPVEPDHGLSSEAYLTKQARERQTLADLRDAFDGAVATSILELAAGDDPNAIRMDQVETIGYSKTCDIERALTFDDKAHDCVVGSKLKLWLARAFNESYYHGPSGHLEVTKDGRAFHRGLSEQMNRLGDVHQLEGGLLQFGTVVVANYVYAVEGRKRTLPPTVAAAKLWAKVMGPTRYFRRGCFFMEPTRFIPVGVLDHYAEDQELPAMRWANEVRELDTFPSWELESPSLTWRYTAHDEIVQSVEAAKAALK